MNEHFILENRYKVNSGAETVLNVLNTILFVVFILLSIAMVGIGIAQYGDGTPYGIAVIAGGVVVFLSSLISWAVVKVVINISRNLFNINDALRSQKV